MKQETIGGRIVHGRINGFAINYTRRRYSGGKWYTWIEYFDGKDWLSLGDPWPCAAVPPSEIRDQIDRMEAAKHANQLTRSA